MKRSSYLDWYIHVPQVKYDLRSSGVTSFKSDLMLNDVDLSVNYAHGNPDASGLLGRRYRVEPENVFISSEGASGQNTRIIRHIAEKDKSKREAVVEFPTYEPLLRKVQEHFPRVKRLERREKGAYRLNADALRKVVSDKTALLVLTNPHAPSGAISEETELEETMTIADEHGFYVLCDEIYAEFDRNAAPTVFSIDSDYGITTTSFTKAYGLGGLKLGVALARKNIVDDLYVDVLNTVGNSPNIVQLIALKLFIQGYKELEEHKKKWLSLRSITEEQLEQRSLRYFPNKIGISYWVRLPVDDTYKWVNEHAVPNYDLAVVPGTFFLFRDGYKLARSSRVRLSLGAIEPEQPKLIAAFETLERALETY